MTRLHTGLRTEFEKRRRNKKTPAYLLIKSSLSSLSISSSMAACRSPILLKASFRSTCRLWLAASRLSMSISWWSGGGSQVVEHDAGQSNRHPQPPRPRTLTSSCFLRLASPSFLDSSPISSFMSLICRCMRLFCSFSRFSAATRWFLSSVIFSRFSLRRPTRAWGCQVSRRFNSRQEKLLNSSCIAR